VIGILRLSELDVSFCSRFEWEMRPSRLDERGKLRYQGPGKTRAHSETIHQSKKRVSKEQSRPGPKEFQFPIMLLVVTASGQAIRRLG
jgi:hypothetical protein